MLVIMMEIAMENANLVEKKRRETDIIGASTIEKESEIWVKTILLSSTCGEMTNQREMAISALQYISKIRAFLLRTAQQLLQKICFAK